MKALFYKPKRKGKAYKGCLKYDDSSGRFTASFNLGSKTRNNKSGKAVFEDVVTALKKHGYLTTYRRGSKSNERRQGVYPGLSLKKRRDLSFNKVLNNILKGVSEEVAK